MRKNWAILIFLTLSLLIATTVNASLIGDVVDLDHHFTGPGVVGSGQVTVTADSSDVWNFAGLYTVDVGADNLKVTVLDYLPPGDTEDWLLSPPDFNGLVASSLNDDSGNPLSNVVVTTTFGGWDNSMLAFGNDQAEFNWAGVTVSNGATFEATFSFDTNAGTTAANAPEPATIFLLGSGLASFLGFGRKKFKK